MQEKNVESSISNHLSSFPHHSNNSYTSADQERKILLLMLLAQVCALHDSTPKTFIVHVLSLYERGILDYDSIAFLFDLGLVPSSSSSSSDHGMMEMKRPMITTPTQQTRMITTTKEDDGTSFQDDTDKLNNRLLVIDGEEEEEEGEKRRAIIIPYNSNQSNSTPPILNSISSHCNDGIKEEAISSRPTTSMTCVESNNNNNINNIDPTIPLRVDSFTQYDTTTTTNNNNTQEIFLLQKRIQEVSLIRKHLSFQESSFQTSSQKSSFQNNKKSVTPLEDLQQKQDELLSSSSSFIPSSLWTVEHYPLSFSRYVRDFYPKAILASGGFGHVFQATNKLDSVDYAIKKIIFSARGYDTQQVDLVIREVQCLAKLDHPNVVRYYTSWLEPSWIHGSLTNRRKNDNSSSSIIHSTTKAKKNKEMNSSGIIPKNKEIERKLLMDVHQLILTREEEKETRNDIFNRISMHVGEKNIKHKNSQNLSNYSWDESVDDDDSIVDDDDDDDDQGDSDCSEWTNQSSSENDSCNMNSSRYEPSSRKQDSDILNPRRSSYKYQICLFIQMQLCLSSTLADWIYQRNQTMASLRKNSTDQQIDYHQHARPAFEIFRQVLKGLVHIHSRGIIHRDLKPANIFASEGGVFKIGDFGLSKLLNMFEDPTSSLDNQGEEVIDDSRRLLLLPPPTTVESDSSTIALTTGQNAIAAHVWGNLHTAGVGTASYAAPEQMRSKSYGPEADIFSLGLILLELFSFFTSEHERAVTFSDCRRGKLPSWISWTYPEVSKLVLACTNQDPLIRPSATEIISLEIFQESSSTEIYKAEIQSLQHDLKMKESEIEHLKHIIQQQEEMICQLEAK